MGIENLENDGSDLDENLKELNVAEKDKATIKKHILELLEQKKKDQEKDNYQLEAEKGFKMNKDSQNNGLKDLLESEKVKDWLKKRGCKTIEKLIENLENDGSD